VLEEADNVLCGVEVAVTIDVEPQSPVQQETETRTPATPPASLGRGSGRFWLVARGSKGLGSAHLEGWAKRAICDARQRHDFYTKPARPARDARLVTRSGFARLPGDKLGRRVPDA
jgi:hypothetical protein